MCPHCGTPQKETVSLGAIHSARETGKKKRSKRKRIARVLTIVLAVLLALIIAAVGAVWLFLDSSLQEGSSLPDESELEINSELPDETVVNIALFGLDNRNHQKNGHSDAIIILSIDRDHNKIKMTSIARDSLVKVEDYPSVENKTKITHAFSYGASHKKQYGSGAALAVKTLNQNFGMNIQRYVYIDFFGFADVIDYLGGVQVEVKDYEMYELNRHIRGLRVTCGMKIDEVKSPGVQTLTGGQALSFARIRKMDSDVHRGNRQRQVLEGAFAQVKKQPMTKIPKIIKKCLSMCYTNISSSELMGLATWAITNTPTVENFSMPEERMQAWGGIHQYYGWVWIYDLKYATALLHDFIYETNVAETMTPERYYG